jgi:hypothetical protein
LRFKNHAKLSEFAEAVPNTKISPQARQLLICNHSYDKRLPYNNFFFRAAEACKAVLASADMTIRDLPNEDMQG